ncbi:MAG: hypothetical protein JO042_11095 [Sinobacteraceae bacterium]|nr:hypothetical protein [Nevskiaceae bacterium]
MSAVEVTEELWERAFQLSYFILRDRPRARECVARAVEKLAAQRSREKRRTYWRTRKKELTIRRISRPAQDTLQWLVFLESEACEKEQELQGQPTEADMVVRYVKHLAQMTTVNSSFHVNIGFNRLLRKYTTPEVQQIYELATSRYPGLEEYRKAKGKLLTQLTARFERFLKVRTAPYGELQFETHEEHRPWSRLVEECLEFFAPWSSHGGCLQVGASGAAALGVPWAAGVDRLETHRCHWFMHSSCYGRLAKQIGFDPPEERLSVPRFLHRDGGGHGCDPGSPERRTAALSADEVEVLRDRMASVVANAPAAAAGPLKIVAHGTVRAVLNPGRTEQRRFEIAEGVRLLEVWSTSGARDQILATHWIDCREDNGFVGGEYTIELPGGRQLNLSVRPVSAPDAPGGGRAVVTIESRCTSSVSERLASVFWGEGDNWLRPTLASVTLVAVGALASAAYFGSRLSQDHLMMGRVAAEVADQKAAIAALERVPQHAVQSVAHYAFRSDAPSLRGTGNPGEPVVSFAPGEAVIILELPVPEGEHGSYHVTLSSFPQEEAQLSEMSLRPVKSGNRWIVEFALPAARVENNMHYLLAMTRGSSGDTRHYIFEVRKE